MLITILPDNGRGLEGKNAGEFVFVYDRRNGARFTAHPSKGNNLLWQTLQAYVSFARLDTLWAAHLSHPVAISYGIPVTLEGRLVPNSTKNLLKICGMSIVEGMKV